MYVMPPTIIFGDISGLVIDDVTPVLDKYGIERLDTAAAYDMGESEKRLGEAKLGSKYIIDTKIMSSPASDGTLTGEKIDASSDTSLESLKLERVNVLYVHAPDYATPIEQQAKGFDDVYKKGKYQKLGLCNLKPDMVQEWLRISQEKGYIKPEVFQGQYNLFCRTLEETLFPLLRQEGMQFVAYSPLAGGFLIGNFTRKGASESSSRFSSHVASQMYRGWYDRLAMYDAFDKLQTLSQSTGIPTDELSMRWLVHHSALTDQDALILGASKPSQIENACANMQKGPLDEETAMKLNALWDSNLQAAAADIVYF